MQTERDQMLANRERPNTCTVLNPKAKKMKATLRKLAEPWATNAHRDLLLPAYLPALLLYPALEPWAVSPFLLGIEVLITPLRQAA